MLVAPLSTLSWSRCSLLGSPLHTKSLAQRTLNDVGTGLAASPALAVVGGPKWLASSARRQLGGVHGRGRTLPCALHVVYQERPVVADHDQVQLYRVDVSVERHVRDTTIVCELADHAHRARR